MANLPASLLAALGLAGCAVAGAGAVGAGVAKSVPPEASDSGLDADSGTGDTGASETGDSVGPCLDTAAPDSESGDTADTAVGPCLEPLDSGETGTGPCLAPMDDTADSADSGLGPCLSIAKPCLCGCGDESGPPVPNAALMVGAALISRRRWDRRSVAERLARAGVLPADVAAKLRGEPER